MFEKISSRKVKINIFKKYKLDQVVQAHKDLENRKILGTAVIIPWFYSTSTSISDMCNFNALVEVWISLIKNIIEIIIDKQQEPKISLAMKTSFK